MGDYIKKIRTITGDKQIDYTALANLPISDKTLSKVGEFADAAAVGVLKEDLIGVDANKISKPQQEQNGKTPRALNGEVEWVPLGLPTEEQTNTAVTDWLNKHPEATTTVQEGSITREKLSKELNIRSVFTENTKEADKHTSDLIKKDALYGQYIIGSNQVIDRVTYENVENNGFIVGESSSSNETSNVTIYNCNITSVNGNRSRKNKNVLGENITFFNNNIHTTGSNNHSVGVELWTPKSKALFNSIKNDTNNGFSGVTLGEDNCLAIGNIVKNFKAGIENSHHRNIISNNIIENAYNGLYHTSSVPSMFSILSDNIIHNSNVGIKLRGANYCVINNCVITSDNVMRPTSTSDLDHCAILAGNVDDSRLDIFVSNCIFHNYQRPIGIQSDNTYVHFKSCIFVLDESAKTEIGGLLNTPMNMIGFHRGIYDDCTFIRCRPGSYIKGAQHYKGCRFLDYGEYPYYKTSGSIVVPHFENCIFEKIEDSYYPFTAKMNTEFRFRAGFVNNIFYTYNYDKDYILNNYKDILQIGTICYDTFLKKTYIYNGVTLNEI